MPAPRVGHKYIKREGTPGNYRYFYYQPGYPPGSPQSLREASTDEEKHTAKVDHVRRMIARALQLGIPLEGERIRMIAHETGISIEKVNWEISNMRHRGRRAMGTGVVSPGTDVAHYGHDYAHRHLDEVGFTVGSNTYNRIIAEKIRAAQENLNTRRGRGTRSLAPVSLESVRVPTVVGEDQSPAIPPTPPPTRPLETLAQTRAREQREMIDRARAETAERERISRRANEIWSEHTPGSRLILGVGGADGLWKITSQDANRVNLVRIGMAGTRFYNKDQYITLVRSGMVTVAYHGDQGGMNDDQEYRNAVSRGMIPHPDPANVMHPRFDDMLRVGSRFTWGLSPDTTDLYVVTGIDQGDSRIHVRRITGDTGTNEILFSQLRLHLPTGNIKWRYYNQSLPNEQQGRDERAAAFAEGWVPSLQTIRGESRERAAVTPAYVTPDGRRVEPEGELHWHGNTAAEERTYVVTEVSPTDFTARLRNPNGELNTDTLHARHFTSAGWRNIDIYGTQGHVRPPGNAPGGESTIPAANPAPTPTPASNEPRSNGASPNTYVEFHGHRMRYNDTLVWDNDGNVKKYRVVHATPTFLRIVDLSNGQEGAADIPDKMWANITVIPRRVRSMHELNDVLARHNVNLDQLNIQPEHLQSLGPETNPERTNRLLGVLARHGIDLDQMNLPEEKISIKGPIKKSEFLYVSH